MTIWAIADIHASQLDETGRPEKPMEVFGEHWRDHIERIEASWNECVHHGDTVIVAGDLEWALRPAEALGTLKRMDAWNGRKLLLRGNHDYWWSSKATARLRKILPPTIDLIHNKSYEIEGFNISGTKGSELPGSREWTDEDAKLLNRELERLRLSFQTRNPNLPTIAALHYPPFVGPQASGPYVEALRLGGVTICVYGHLHGDASRLGPHGLHAGTYYALVAVDYLNFQPLAIAEEGQILLPSGVVNLQGSANC